MTRTSQVSVGLLTLHTNALVVLNNTGVLTSMQLNEAVVAGTESLSEFDVCCTVIAPLSVGCMVPLDCGGFPWPLLQILM